MFKHWTTIYIFSDLTILAVALLVPVNSETLFEYQLNEFAAKSPPPRASPLDLRAVSFHTVAR
jgi:hypothetical protein